MEESKIMGQIYQFFLGWLVIPICTWQTTAAGQ